MEVGTFDQQRHTSYSVADGLPAQDVTAIAITPEGVVQARTPHGSANLDGSRWSPVSAPLPVREWPWYPTLAAHIGTREAVRWVATQGDEVAVAAENGLYIGDGETWALALPREGAVRWA